MFILDFFLGGLMDQFIEAHPDAVYHNARGTVALTGYDGILGYRTDGDYKTREDLTDDQVAWLDAHPDFDWDKECEEAKKVADAIKADGWTFASHTWGHIRVGDKPIETIQADTEKWLSVAGPPLRGRNRGTAHRRKRYHHLCTWTGSFRLARLHDGQ